MANRNNRPTAAQRRLRKQIIVDISTKTHRKHDFEDTRKSRVVGSKYGYAGRTAQPMEKATEDHIKSNLKGMTTRGSGRKPSMPKMPWSNDETSKD